MFSSNEHEFTYLKIKTHVFPIAHVVAIFLEHSKAYPTHRGYRPATKKSKIQNTDCLSLTERIEHPIGHVKVQLPGLVSFFLLFFKITMFLQTIPQIFIGSTNRQNNFQKSPTHYPQNIFRRLSLYFKSHHLN